MQAVMSGRAFRGVVFGLACALAFVGCLGDGAIECADGLLCPASQACAPHGGGCVDPAAAAACAGAADLTACAVPGTIADGVCGAEVCVPAGCGNALVEVDEVCDDGNQVDGDGCSRGCDSLEACGNQVVDPGEQCDDGNATDQDGCRPDCTIVQCGDGVVDALRGEACDAGSANSNEPDAPCRLTCQLPRCGDGIADLLAGEVCDDGNQLVGDGCRPDCKSSGACGNGVVDVVAGEACDDGNLRDRDGCSSACGDEPLAWRRAEVGTPPPRQQPAMAYDAARGRIVMFGGEVAGPGGTTHLDDTWEFDGAAWLRRTPAVAPPPRAWGVMGYDAAHGRTILFGGASEVESHWGDTWAWDGETWTDVAPPTAPQGRLHSAMAYDGARQRLVLFGGWTSRAQPIINDTWEFDGATWLETTPATSPPARYLASMAYDPARGHVVLFGGGGADFDSLVDTWTYDGVAWTEVTTPVHPNAYGCGQLAFDGVHLLLSGCTSQMWAFDDGWTSLPVTFATPRGAFGMAADGSRGQIVLFGGGNDGTERGDTWAWSGGSWSELSPPAQPGARQGAMVAYDAARARVVLFGGQAAGGGLLADTWEFDGARWHARALAVVPPARRLGTLTYDVARRRVVLFGGELAGGPANDTWEYDGTAWIGRAPLASPPARVSAAATYDAARGVTVLVGGSASGVPFADTWEYDGTTWTSVATATTPPAVQGATLVYDPGHAQAVLFGGDAVGSYLDQTWVYDGTDWQQLSVAGAPPARAYAVAGYDPVRQRVVVLSGDDYDALYADVREFDGDAWSMLNVPGDQPGGRIRAALAYDQARRQFVMFGGNDGPRAAPGVPLADTWTLGYVATRAGDACVADLDLDDDGQAGCADDDCWGVCAPLCPPGADPDACPATPVCGDGVCGDVEDCRTCPDDCVVGVDCVARCGDTYCDAGTESAATCPGDCGPP